MSVLKMEKKKNLFNCIITLVTEIEFQTKYNIFK